MMILGGYITYPNTEDLKYGTILKLLRFYRDDIGQQILDRIEARTPVDTGALREDEAYRPFGGPGGILQWYLGADYQEAEWNRFYGPYQEGPPLGLSTYTTGEWRMFDRVETDDMPLISTWAEDVVREAVDNITTDAPTIREELG